MRHLLRGAPAREGPPDRRPDSLVLRRALACIGAWLAVSSVLAGAPTTRPVDQLSGYWEGVMTRERAALPVTLTFAAGADGYTGTWSAPSMRALGVPLKSVVVKGLEARFELAGDQSSTLFEGRIQGKRLAGRFSEGEGKGIFELTRKPAPTPVYREVEAGFANGEVKLAGTLLLPPAPGPRPGVVFVQGAGAEGRHGSRYLADALARRGIAALIYDKRGVGASGGDWRKATPADLADDAVAAVRWLAGREEVDGRRIGIYGHSQGGLIAPLAATRSPDVAFVVAGATYGGWFYEQDLYRVENALRASEFTKAEQAEALAFYRKFVEVARTKKGMNRFEKEAEPVRARPWFEWLGIPPRDHWVWEFYPPFGNSDSLAVWQLVRVPVLLIYGEEDQVLPVGLSLWRIGLALDAGGNHQCGSVILPRASHDFTIRPRAGGPFEWPRVAPGLGDLVAGWVLLREPAEPAHPQAERPASHPGCDVIH
jgi:hypothetical protein